MHNLYFHLAYLLTKHECVIVPGLGAFVVNALPVNKDNTGRWTCPGKTLSFNSQITHNDGLLANSIALEKGIAYKEASLLMKKDADRIESILASGEPVRIPWVGTLTRLSDSKILFATWPQLSCNYAYYGLKNIYLDPLVSLEKEERELEVAIQTQQREEVELAKPSRWKGVVTATAAVAALFLLALPVSDPTADRSLQKASFIAFPKLDSIALEESAVEITAEAMADAPADPVVEIKAEPNTRYYYIVIASLPTAELAEKKVQQYRAGDFPLASVISSGDKHRIYMNRFDDKDDAEIYLEQFRTTHPKHAKAWLLAQRG